MRFCYGSVPETPGFRPEAEGWRPLREPGPWLLQVLAFPPAIILLALDTGLLGFIWPEGFNFSDAFAAFSIPGLLAAILASVVLHELLHLAFHPGAGLTSNSVLGAWPSKGLFYAHYDGPLARNRSLLVGAAPCVVMAVVPALLVGVLSTLHAPVHLLNRLAFLSMFGAICGCGDVVVMLLLLFQVPFSATLRNQGWKTYWKAA